MITEKDLQEAIAECKGQRNPSAQTCIKLAAFYILKDHLFPEDRPMYSYAPPPESIENIIDYQSDTDFGRAVNGRTIKEVFPVIDDLMTATYVYNKPLYDATLRELG